MDLWYPHAINDPQQDGGSMTGGPYKGVLHTTESGGYPTYRPGTHPHFTIWLDKGTARVKQHVPLDRAARALRNADGGAQTNRDSAIQIEVAWYAVKAPAIPTSLLDPLRDLMRWIEAQTGIHRRSPAFKAYPDSYGLRNGVRMTAAEWDRFDGWCGHQHVPENDHGDPGLINIGYLLGAPEDDLTPDELALLKQAATDASLAAARTKGLVAMLSTVSKQLSAVSRQTGIVSRQVSGAAGADASATKALKDAVAGLDAANVSATAVVDELANRLKEDK